MYKQKVIRVIKVQLKEIYNGINEFYLYEFHALKIDDTTLRITRVQIQEYNK